MGLLDEAIRDHLDLKRRRGADPTEIERAQAEALGPVRRDPFEHGPDDFEAFAEDRPRAYDHEEEVYDDEGYEEYGAEEEWAEEFEGEPHLAPEGAARPENGEVADSTTVMDHEYLEEPQAPAAHEPGAPPSYPAEPGAGDETMQYDVEEALAAEGPETERSPEWVEQSDEWVEQSDEWVEPSPPPVEPSHEAVDPADEPLESPHEPEHGAPPTEAESAYFEPTEHDFVSEETAPHGEPHAPRHDPETEHRGTAEEDVRDETPEFAQDEPDHDQLWFEQRPPRDLDG